MLMLTPRYIVPVLSFCAILAILVFLLSGGSSIASSIVATADLRISFNLKASLWDSWHMRVHSLHNDRFTIKGVKEFIIPEDNYRWKESLGKRVLILDVDSRLDPNVPGTMLNPEKLKPSSIKGRTSGMLNHFLYALIHGYDYRLVRAPNPDDRHGTWVKVPAMQEALRTHDIVVFMDADAVFQHLDLPLEWLMSLWGVNNQTAMALSEDLDEASNYDNNNRLFWNTGFVIAQNLPQTQELFSLWWDCPSEQHYEGCGHWRYNWAHEQAALAYYLRYEFEDRFLAVPCSHANGNFSIPGCEGYFVSHYWHTKETATKDLYTSPDVSEEFVEGLHREFLLGKDKYYRDLKEYEYPLVDVII